MKTLILLLFTVFLLADCGDKPRIKKKTPEQIKKDRSVSKEKEDNRRTVGVRKRRRSRRRSSSSTVEERFTIPEEDIESLRTATGGIRTVTVHNDRCPTALYTANSGTTPTRNFENKLKQITFNDGNYDSSDHFIRKINVRTDQKITVHLKKSILEDFTTTEYTWFLYFEDHRGNDADNHPLGNIQYEAVQLKPADDLIGPEGAEEADKLYQFNEVSIGNHVLEFIANVDLERSRGRPLYNQEVNIVFAIGTSNQCIELHEPI